ncbi:hypothetical protein BV898_01922 [Hypsibius exemplaris]|uniref:Uncharacterized protein n=1 Tax=Hypsibius exemplaris TaxID=2072580 RepID=A0A1W0XA33_HYPEX|nr:hypothetical protein BV898_01922 [Hypsibius exemplaris]
MLTTSPTTTLPPTTGRLLSFGTSTRHPQSTNRRTFVRPAHPRRATTTSTNTPRRLPAPVLHPPTPFATTRPPKTTSTGFPIRRESLPSTTTATTTITTNPILTVAGYLLHRRRQQQAVNPSPPPAVEMTLTNFSYRDDAGLPAAIQKLLDKEKKRVTAKAKKEEKEKEADAKDLEASQKAFDDAQKKRFPIIFIDEVFDGNINTNNEWTGMKVMEEGQDPVVDNRRLSLFDGNHRLHYIDTHPEAGMGPETYLRCKVYVKLTEIDNLALAEDENRRIDVGLANTDVDEMRIYCGIKRRCQELEDDEDIKNVKVQSEACNKDYMLARRNMTFLSGETAKYSEKAQPRRKDGRPSLIMFKYIWSTGEGKDDAERYNLLATNIDFCTELGKVVDCSTDEKRAAAVKMLEVKKASPAGKKRTKREASSTHTSKKKSIKQEIVDSARLDYLERLVNRQRKIIKLSRNSLTLTGHLAIFYQNDQLLFIKKWSKSGAKEYHFFVRFVMESPNFQYDFATETINITSWCGFNNNDMEYDEELSEEEEEEENIDDNAE